MFEGGESVPLAGEEKTTLSDAPDPPPLSAFGKPRRPQPAVAEETHPPFGDGSLISARMLILLLLFSARHSRIRITVPAQICLAAVCSHPAV